jgi:3-oxoacyl-[acyl-carrier protein] reductase
MSIPLSLSGKVALISGGSRGIGAATVRMFAAAGAKVVFSYQKARSQAEALARECGAGSCHAVACNLDSPDAARALIAETVKHFGRLDILVANHGVWPPEDVAIERMTDEHWRTTMSINLDAVFGLVKYGVAQMKSQPRAGITAGHDMSGNDMSGNDMPGNDMSAHAISGPVVSGPAAGHVASGHIASGHIVLISSTSGQRGEAFHCDYSATKGALISMTKSLSAELAADGIYVNCVAPGWVDTDMSKPALEDPEVGAKIRSTIPLGRAGRPEEIAAPVLFLCTELAGFITGEVFNVNGGAVLAG